MAPATDTKLSLDSDPARDFGNEQDMSVHDKEHPTLGPTEEAQEVATLNRIIVPMGAFTDPSNPAAQSASVNLALDKSPVTHSDDYGRSQTTEVGLKSHPVTGTMDEHSLSVATLEPDGFKDGVPDPMTARGAPAAQQAAAKVEEAPADRAEWAKADWVAQARTLGLAVSGNTDTVKDRVEEHEASVKQAEADHAERVDAAKDMNAGDWNAQIADAEDLDALDALKKLYTDSGAGYTTVDAAFTAREAEFNAES